MTKIAASFILRVKEKNKISQVKGHFENFKSVVDLGLKQFGKGFDSELINDLKTESSIVF